MTIEDFEAQQRIEERARRKDMKRMKKKLENRLNGVEDDLDDEDDEDDDDDLAPIPHNRPIISPPTTPSDAEIYIKQLATLPGAVGSALLDVAGVAGEGVRVVAAGAKDVSDFGIGVLTSGFGLLTLASWITSPTLDQEEEAILLRDNAPEGMHKHLVSRLATSLVESLRLAPHFTAIITGFIIIVIIIIIIIIIIIFNSLD